MHGNSKYQTGGDITLGVSLEIKLSKDTCSSNYYSCRVSFLKLKEIYYSAHVHRLSAWKTS